MCFVCLKALFTEKEKQLFFFSLMLSIPKEVGVVAIARRQTGGKGKTSSARWTVVFF